MRNDYNTLQEGPAAALLKKRLRRRAPQLIGLIGLVLVLAAVYSAAWRFPAAEVIGEEEEPTLVIDPGHGGIDGGAVAFDGTKESHINLSISLKLANLADFCGLSRAMTRENDARRTELLAYSEHDDLVKRAEQINDVPNGVLISIHQNTFPNSQPFGAQVLYASGEESRRFGELTHGNLVRLLQPENRRVAEPASPGLYLTAHVQCPAILVECGFLSNLSDLDRLKDNSYQTKLAAVLLSSYLQYIADERPT